MEDDGQNMRALRRSEARYRAIVDTSLEAIITIDIHGIVESFNPAAQRMFGLVASDVLGQNVSLLMPSAFADSHDGYLQHYVETGKAAIIGMGREVIGRRKDGSNFPLHLSVAESDFDGTRQFTGILRDITELKGAEAARDTVIAELREANAELERFAYTVSHDLKSPLITIKGFLGMARQDATDGETARFESDMDRVAAAADKMTQLLDDLLELSRIGRAAEPTADVPMAQVATEVVELLAGPIATAAATIVIAPGLPVVRGDATRLREVLQNLVENALKFRREGVACQIEIGARADGDAGVASVIHVRDNGIGVEPHLQDKIFGLFEQLDPSKTGSGVGLALVKRIIEVHGGRVWVESDGPGRGTTFYFNLPAAS